MGGWVWCWSVRGCDGSIVRESVSVSLCVFLFVLACKLSHTIHSARHTRSNLLVERVARPISFTWASSSRKELAPIFIQFV